MEKETKSKKTLGKQGTAQIGALLTQNKSYSTLRLLKDYDEVQKNPMPGIAVTPINNTFLKWRANIKCIDKDSLYEGAVLHIELLFTDLYPIDPPTISVLNNFIDHPNIVGKNLCLDMLDKLDGEAYKGWTPSYTILSILMQLQSFFFDENKKKKSTYLSEDDKLKIRDQVLKVNEFTDKCSGHKGAKNPKPEFPEIPKVTDVLQVVRENVKNEYSCVMRKIGFWETPIGVGISISRVPRTGEIKGINVIQEYISLKSFQKQRIRSIGFQKQRFTFWLPIYFGKDDNLDRFTLLSERSISMICTGSTRNFKPEMIMKFFPKILSNMISELSNEKIPLSCQLLKFFLHCFVSFRIMVNKYPEIQVKIENYVNDFITNPTSRLKENTNSLADLLVFSLLCEKNKMKELLPLYIGESLDRSIFWMIKLIPEFEELLNSSAIDNVRAKVCFKAGIVGHHILLVFNFINENMLFKETKSNKDMLTVLLDNYACLEERQLYDCMKQLREIFKIDSFERYYKQLNLPVPSDNELNLKLKQANQNSLAKKYHGDIDEFRYVPETKQQIQIIMNKFESIQNLMKDNKLLPANDPVWEKVCMNLDTSVKLKHILCRKFTSFELAKFYESELEFSLKHTNVERFEKARAIENMDKRPIFSYQLETNYQDEFLSKMTFRDIFIKMFFESYIKYFRYIIEFKELYSYIDLFADEITHFNLVIDTDEGIKSDYNYIRVILAGLKKVKFLKIFVNTNTSLKLVKNLIKGYSLFEKNGGITEHFKLFIDKSFTNLSNNEFNMLTILEKMNELKTLDCSDTALNNYNILRIRNHLYNHKTIQSLNLKNSSLSNEFCKELADGIMKAKNLQTLDLSDNNCGKGIPTMIYNLAFQPNFKSLNVSKCTVDLNEMASAIYKLIKMSMSLEYVDLSNISSLNSSLTKDFFFSLGENSCLKALNMNQSGGLSSTNLTYLGNAIAFNTLKKGELVSLSLENCGINSYDNFERFVDALSISENCHNIHYNSPFNRELTKDNKEYYNKHFYCKLKYLNLNESNIQPGFSINDPKNLRVNALKTLTLNAKNLENISLNKSKLNKYFVELIVDALKEKNSIKILSLSSSGINGDHTKLLMTSFGDKEKSNEFNIIQYLDLSNNNFGYSGIEAISNTLFNNKSLIGLNLYHNIFDVNGARRLAEALNVNSTLEAIDIGYNRIKELGLFSILMSLKNNKNTKLKLLGCRYNYIKNKLFTHTIESMIAKENKLEIVEFRNNQIEEKLLIETFSSNYQNDHVFKVDLFEGLYYTQSYKIEKTIWISPVDYSSSKSDILKAIYKTESDYIKNNNERIGIVQFIAIKRGRKVGCKKDNNNCVAFVEFIHPNSANMMLKVASQDGFYINGKKMMVYKAGTRTEYIKVKPTKYNATNIKSGIKTATRNRRDERPRGRGARPVRGRGGFKQRGGRGRGK